VVNNFNIQFKTPSIVTHIYVTILPFNVTWFHTCSYNGRRHHHHNHWLIWDYSRNDGWARYWTISGWEEKMVREDSGVKEVIGNCPPIDTCKTKTEIEWEKSENKGTRTVDVKKAVFFLFGLWGYWHRGHSWPIVPASDDNEDDCGEADGM
jgi:hypothetical protein